jgi:ribonuclease P protein component
VTRRASLPGASELFRPTSFVRPADPEPTVPAPTESPDVAKRPSTGRQKHDTKITVYVSDEELLALEHARLSVRASYGLAVDRGRIVREAIAVLLADLERHGDGSQLVRRLRRESER